VLRVSSRWRTCVLFVFITVGGVQTVDAAPARYNFFLTVFRKWVRQPLARISVPIGQPAENTPTSDGTTTRTTAEKVP